MKWENDTFALIQRMSAMVYSSKKFESLWFLYQSEGLPKIISIEDFLDKPIEKFDYFTKHGVGAKVSVLSHTFIETCKIGGVSSLDYYKEFFKAAIKREQFQNSFEKCRA